MMKWDRAQVYRSRVPVSNSLICEINAPFAQDFQLKVCMQQLKNSMLSRHSRASSFKILTMYERRLKSIGEGVLAERWDEGGWECVIAW